MNTVKQMDDLVQVARDAGYVVRYEYFGGTGGGYCEVGGKQIVFVDLALSSIEQLDRLQEILVQRGLWEQDPGPATRQRAA